MQTDEIQELQRLEAMEYGERYYRQFNRTKYEDLRPEHRHPERLSDSDLLDQLEELVQCLTGARLISFETVEKTCPGLGYRSTVDEIRRRLLSRPSGSLSSPVGSD